MHIGSIFQELNWLDKSELNWFLFLLFWKDFG